jgi:hypothetical protein
MIVTLRTESKIVNTKMAGLLTERRLGEGMNMQRLANAIERPHSFIAKIEKLRRRLDVGEFVYYCQAMNQDPLEVLKQLLALSSERDHSGQD